MLKQRIPTAIALILLVSAAIFGLSFSYFQIFLGFVIAIGAWEWAGLSGLKNSIERLLYSLFIALLLFFARNLTTANPELLANLLWISLCCWLIVLLFVCVYPGFTNMWGSKIMLLLAGIFVLVPGWMAIIYLRADEHSSALILLLLAIVAAADIGAYFSGKAFGTRKLAPQVSPNKTWEGYWGGVVACCLVAAGVALYYSSLTVELPQWFWVKVLLSAWLLSSFSVVGDLLESMVKRYRGVKDSGSILPGHGGVLDRIDGITAAAPVFALLKMYVIL